MAISFKNNSYPETTCDHFNSPQNSVLKSINTGFGPSNTLQLQCDCNHLTLLPLYKESYLSEFSTEEEKAKVRLNLGVLSSIELDSKLSKFATKADVDKIIARDLDLLNYYTKDELDSKLKNLNTNLDLTPTKNSTNGVTSGGVWKYIDETVGEIHRYVDKI